MTYDNKNRNIGASERRPKSGASNTARRPVQKNARYSGSADPHKRTATAVRSVNTAVKTQNGKPAQIKRPPKKKENPKLSAVKKIFAILGTTILSIFLIVIITGTIVTTAATIYVLEFMDETADVTITELASSANTIVYANKGKNELVELYTVTNDIQRVPVEIEKIPQHVRDAFVCIEDERFYSHEGVDYKRTFAAFANMFIHIYDTKQGGSTITQQLIKNLTGDDDPRPERKIREIFRAMQFEKKYSKDEILENYLNYIGFGGPTNGIQLAAVKYFGKDVSELTIAEAACLAAIPKSPETLNPFADREKNRDRQENVLHHMYANGNISYEQYQEALNEKLIFTDSEEYKKEHPEANADKMEKQKATSWVVDTALREYAAILMDEYGITEKEAFTRINNGGYQIYTTVNLKMQDYVQEKYLDLSNLMDPDSNHAYDDDDNKIYPQSSFIAMNYKGEIQCIVGGIGEKTESLAFNRATMAQRQPGSCMKPVATYGLALYTDHIHWGSMYKDSPIKLEEDGKDWPNNYDYIWSGANTPIYDALRRSRNTIPAQLCKELTPQSVFNFSTKNLGLDLVDATESGASDIAYAPLTIGALTYGVSIENLVNAYLPYGNGGTYYGSHIISRVEKGDGSLVYDNDGDPHEAVDKETAYVMNKLLQEVIKSGTGTAAQLDNKTVAGKTGTSEDWNDLCFVGMTEDFISGVWIGYDTKTELNTSLSSAQVWYNIIGEYANKVKSDKSYPDCDDVISAPMCPASGCIAESGCSKGITGYWKSTNAPHCSNHYSTNKNKDDDEDSSEEEEQPQEENNSQPETIEVVPENPPQDNSSSQPAANPEPAPENGAE